MLFTTSVILANARTVILANARVHLFSDGLVHKGDENSDRTMRALASARFDDISDLPTSSACLP
jgi:hypothetical protein